MEQEGPEGGWQGAGLAWGTDGGGATEMGLRPVLGAEEPGTAGQCHWGQHHPHLPCNCTGRQSHPGLWDHTQPPLLSQLHPRVCTGFCLTYPC